MPVLLALARTHARIEATQNRVKRAQYGQIHEDAVSVAVRIPLIKFAPVPRGRSAVDGKEQSGLTSHLPREEP
jgi:hypothetical protein